MKSKTLYAFEFEVCASVTVTTEVSKKPHSLNEVIDDYLSKTDFGELSLYEYPKPEFIKGENGKDKVSFVLKEATQKTFYAPNMETAKKEIRKKFQNIQAGDLRQDPSLSFSIVSAIGRETDAALLSYRIEEARRENLKKQFLLLNLESTGYAVLAGIEDLGKIKVSVYENPMKDKKNHSILSPGEDPLFEFHQKCICKEENHVENPLFEFYQKCICKEENHMETFKTYVSLIENELDRILEKYADPNMVQVSKEKNLNKTERID